MRPRIRPSRPGITSIPLPIFHRCRGCLSSYIITMSSTWIFVECFCFFVRWYSRNDVTYSLHHLSQKWESILSITRLRLTSLLLLPSKLGARAPSKSLVSSRRRPNTRWFGVNTRYQSLPYSPKPWSVVQIQLPFYTTIRRELLCFAGSKDSTIVPTMHDFQMKIIK